jgi:hypothetical protein
LTFLRASYWLTRSNCCLSETIDQINLQEIIVLVKTGLNLSEFPFDIENTQKFVDSPPIDDRNVTQLNWNWKSVLSLPRHSESENIFIIIIIIIILWHLGPKRAFAFVFFTLFCKKLFCWHYSYHSW